MEKKNNKEKVNNNKKQYRLIKKGIPFCKFKSNQKMYTNYTNHKQLNDPLLSSAERFCKSSTSQNTIKSRPVPKIRQTRVREPFKGVLFSAQQKDNSLLKSSILKSSSARDTTKKNIFLKKGKLEELKNKFINLLMRNGEKSKASKLFADSLKQVEEKRDVNNSTLKVFDFFNTQKKQLLDLDQKQHKQKKENENNIINNPDRVKQNYQNKGGQPVCTPWRKETRIGKDKNKFKNSEEDFNNDFLTNNILYQAVENVKPTLELRRVRKGGTTYQVPAIVSQKKQERLAIKWIIESAEKKNKKNNKSFSNCLVSEILDAFNKTGQPRQRRDEQLKIAEFNRAYTRYRWW